LTTGLTLIIAILGDDMKSVRFTLLIACVAILSLVACSGDQSPTETSAAIHQRSFQTTTGMTFPEISINNFLVRFDGRTVDTSGTTFNYTVRGTGVAPDLTHFTVEIPQCTVDPVAFDPTNSVSINYDPNTEIYGIDWHLSVSSGDLTGRHYSVTFPGDVPLGEVQAAVWNTNTYAIGYIPGPCAGFDISGRVFTDANKDSTLDADESGLGNVVVELVNADGAVWTATTDATGAYLFRKAPGTYTVRINTDPTAYPNALNGQLGSSFDATTDLSYEVTVGPDAAGNDFGFYPRTQQLIYDLESGTLLTTGLSVKDWTKILRGALNDSHPPGGYAPETVVGFVQDVRELGIEDPFVFADGFEGVQQAFDVLTSNSRAQVDLLLKELLATELNEVSGQGLVGQPGLQLALISWGESLVAQAWAAQQTTKGGDFTSYAKTSGGDLVDATSLFGLMNTGGGGSVDE
jgi:hypothetical protein